MAYKFLEHTADIKFKANGNTLEEMYKYAGEALIETICGEVEVKSIKEKNFSVEGEDFEELLLNFLEEFLFLLDAEDFLPSKIKSIRLQNKKISCVTLGDDSKNYNFANHVKAITYNSMKIEKQKGKFECVVVLDV